MVAEHDRLCVYDTYYTTDIITTISLSESLDMSSGAKFKEIRPRKIFNKENS